MKILFAPAIIIMNRMRYPVKFTVLNLIVIIPLFILTWTLVSNINADLDFLYHEHKGVAYIEKMRNLIEGVVEHREMNDVFLKGDDKHKKNIKEINDAIDKHIFALEKLNIKTENKLIAKEEVDEVRLQWNNIKSNLKKESDKEMFKRHSNLIETIIELLGKVGNTSEIALDPDLDSYNLGGLLLSQLPILIDNIGRSRGVANNVAIAGQFTPDEFVRLSILMDRMKVNSKTMSMQLQTALKSNAKLEKNLTSAAKINMDSIQRFLNILDRNLLKPDSTQIDSNTVLTTGDFAVNSSFKLYDAILPELEQLFLDRIKYNEFLRNLALFISISVMFVLSYLFIGLNISVNQSIKQVGYATQQLSDGDLTTHLDLQTHDEMNKIGSDFNDMVDKFEALIQQIISATTQLATASEELSMVAKDSALNIDKQRIETDQVATAMNQMSATVQEVARNAASAAGSANSADNDAQSGKIIVQQTSEAISHLAKEVDDASEVIHSVEQDSEQIGSILDVIKDIAEQTNLLALNAAIEAARAGDQGRGFAVVADEVRTLASRTHKSTQEIEQMITRLQDGAKNAVDVMAQGKEKAQKGMEQANEAAESLDAITRAVTIISEMNTQIASAAEEQSTVSDEMNRNIISISQVSVKTAEGAEQTTRSSEELAKLAAQLQELIAQFKITS